MSISCDRSPAMPAPRAWPTGDARTGRGDRPRHGRHGRAGARLYRDPDRRAAHARPPHWCSTTGSGRTAADLPPDPAAVAEAAGDPRAKRPGHYRARRARHWRRNSALSRRRRRALSRHAGKPGLCPPITLRSPAPCAARRWVRPTWSSAGPQARLSARLRLSGGLPRCALCPHLRHRRRADRQPPRAPELLATSRSRSTP